MNEGRLLNEEFARSSARKAKAKERREARLSRVMADMSRFRLNGADPKELLVQIFKNVEYITDQTIGGNLDVMAREFCSARWGPADDGLTAMDYCSVCHDQIMIGVFRESDGRGGMRHSRKADCK